MKDRSVPSSLWLRPAKPVQKTDAKIPSTPLTPHTPHTTSFVNAFTSAPPVPPLPDFARSDPAEDNSATVRRADTAKALPVAPALSEESTRDDASLVVVEVPTSIPNTEDVATVKRNKRRSMSVSEVELRNAMSTSAAWTPLPQTPDRNRKETPSWNDPGLKGVLRDIQGALYHLDPETSASFTLKDPSTPNRRLDLHRTQTDTSIPTSSSGAEKPSAARSFTSPNTPTLVLQPPGTDEDSQVPDDALSPIVPPRTTSLQMSPRSPNPPVTPLRQAGWKQNPSPLRVRSGSGAGNPHAPSASKLKSLHRSTASSSEPSLIPVDDDLSSRTRRNSVRLLPSSSSVTHLHSETVTREPIDASDDGPDVELRGKELAYRCWIEDEEFLPKDKIAEWLGGL